jgi:hypothetical protein
MFHMANGKVIPLSFYRLLFGVLLAISASSQPIDEYEVKAAFLYNFAKFVEWPALTFKNSRDPLRICVMGQNPFGRALVDEIGGKTIAGRPLVYSDVSDASRVADCQILFIASSERKRLPSLFALLPRTGVLTVGETEGFASQGGIVNLKLEGGRVRLEIDVEAAGQAHLRISAKVLNLAEIVGARPKP